MSKIQTPKRPAPEGDNEQMFMDAETARKRIQEIVDAADQSVENIDKLLNELAEEMQGDESTD